MQGLLSAGAYAGSMLGLIDDDHVETNSSPRRAQTERETREEKETETETEAEESSLGNDFRTAWRFAANAALSAPASLFSATVEAATAFNTPRGGPSTSASAEADVGQLDAATTDGEALAGGRHHRRRSHHRASERRSKSERGSRRVPTTEPVFVIDARQRSPEAHDGAVVEVQAHKMRDGMWQRAHAVEARVIELSEGDVPIGADDS